ncbi:enoyl-CoA hydratase/isomerase family protein [Nocardia sp. NBC_00565]|uniref:enoyl-CoA hydratase/isomerase family protein n=1 Tax=Nocardia sp. NBC_00565 TaxID=2975993 RepID=UPI002E81952B|nr:enoyl-CoA hydratase/isomerase family protein [Nocardia sp. NBC_00565]WUC04705.1 enoyl-CoA hydratase/isomerase family protein [Nocardia sp. NBC_00565]
MNERISVDKVNHVATLTLSRPEKHNAFDGVALQEFGQCMDELSKDEDTRAIIITGAGKSFCAGSDTAYISEIQADMGKSAGRFNFHKPFGPYQVLPSSLHNCPKPTIAAINGFTSGIAVALISLCDYRIASERASFTPQFVNFGLAAEMGISYTLPRVTSLSVALEFLSTGEKRDAQWAKECGLVKEVTSPEGLMKSAMELADKLASMPPVSVENIKRLVYQAIDPGFEAQLQFEARVGTALGQTEDCMEAVVAMMEKRAPVFKGK